MSESLCENLTTKNSGLGKVSGVSQRNNLPQYAVKVAFFKSTYLQLLPYRIEQFRLNQKATTTMLLNQLRNEILRGNDLKGIYVH